MALNCTDEKGRSYIQPGIGDRIYKKAKHQLEWEQERFCKRKKVLEQQTQLEEIQNLELNPNWLLSIFQHYGIGQHISSKPYEVYQIDGYKLCDLLKHIEMVVRYVSIEELDKYRSKK